MTLKTLRLLQQLLHDQQLRVGAPDTDIAEVLEAKRELAEAIAERAAREDRSDA